MKLRDFDCFWSFHFVLHQFTSQCAVLWIADRKECRRIFTGTPGHMFGLPGFTGFSLNFIATAVWSTAAPSDCLISLLLLRYFGHCHTAAFFSVNFSFFRFDLACFCLFWFTLFAVRWFPMRLWSLAWLRGCDWWLWLDDGRVDPGHCSLIGLYYSVAINPLCEVVSISLLLDKVDKYLQKWTGFSVTLIHSLIHFN